MAKDTFLNRKQTLICGVKQVDLSSPKVMGILNITPDSFYANSRLNSLDQALQLAEKHLTEGASILDIGAYSSRPGATDLSEQQEIDRLIPMIKAVREQFPNTILSVDTFRAKVAEQAMDAGVDLINDISAGELDPAMFATVARLGVPYLMMHMRGNPKNMQMQTQYTNIVQEVTNYFEQKVAQLTRLGVKQMLIDPGFGFAKTTEQNFQLLQQLDQLQKLNLPILVGFSRKSMIYKTLNISPSEALNGTTVLNTIGLLKGAAILRVHDVKEAVESVRLFESTQNFSSVDLKK